MRWFAPLASCCALLTLTGCGEVSQGDDTGKEGGACLSNGTCDPGLVCLSNLCVKEKDSGMPDMPVDLALPDMNVPDMSSDLPVPDISAPDQGQDQSGPDGPVADLPLPDAPSPDQTKPDLPAADLPAPDQAKPDLPAPDLPTPDLLLPDQKFTPDQGTVATPKMVTIKAGTIQMGSPSSEPCRQNDETQHQVTLSNDFEIQNVEVTQGQFKNLMGYNPSKFSSCGSTCPVENVSWYEAAAYANALSAQKGTIRCYACTGSGASVNCTEATAYAGTKIYACPGYRLPTEAEWEFAYRAGTSTALYNGGITNCSGKDPNLDKIGWYDENSDVTYTGCSSSLGRCMGTHPAGQKTPNAWGLHDMAGNVWEWCHDWYNSSYGSSPVTNPVGPPGSSRVNRGGGWKTSARSFRAATRHYWSPGTGNIYSGFRLARSALPKPVAHWKFDEGTGTVAKDSSGNGNDGIINGATWSTGVDGKALSMDGVNDYVRVKHASTLNPTKFTYSAWVKVGKLPYGSVDLVSKRTPSNQNQGPALLLINDGAVWIHWTVASTNYGAKSKAAMFQGAWLHVASSYDGTMAKIFINGEFAISSAVAIPPSASNTDDITLGTDGSSINFFDGILDDVQIFDTALTEGQVKLLYGSAPSCSDGIQNGSETDIDCGGSRCNKCADTKECSAVTDCLSGICTNKICTAGCVHQPVVKDCYKDASGGEWCKVPGGCFQMGSPSNEACRDSGETQHQVTLTNNFEIVSKEVTQAQFTALMGYNPSYFSSCGGYCPVDYVTWHEAAAYANALSAKAGKAKCYACTGSGTSVSCIEATAYSGNKVYTCPGYRLPTEAEWEFAYRAGTSTAFYNGGITFCSGSPDPNLDKMGWYKENSSNKTHPVGQKTPNAWGLYDMAGNVWEWCHDWYGSLSSSSGTDPVGTTGLSRVVRGGCGGCNAGIARAATRSKDNNGNRDLGFRLARSVP